MDVSNSVFARCIGLYYVDRVGVVAQGGGGKYLVFEAHVSTLLPVLQDHYPPGQVCDEFFPYGAGGRRLVAFAQVIPKAVGMKSATLQNFGKPILLSSEVVKGVVSHPLPALDCDQDVLQ